MNKLSKLRQQSASSIGSVNSRHAATHNPLSAIAHIKAADNATSRRQPADDNPAADQPDVKRQKLSSTAALSSPPPLHIPDPNATQERVRRKAPSKPVQTNLPPSNDTATSLPSPALAVGTPAASSSYTAAATGNTAWNIQDDVVSERRFYQTVLSLDPTNPSTAAVPAVPLPSPPPSPPYRFNDARSYQSFFLPLLLSDFACQLQQSYDTNAALPHSYAAQLSPLILLQAGREAEGGRGVGEDMWRAELLDGGGGMDRDDRRRCERQLKEWTSGDLALLRHHQKDDTTDAEKQQSTRGGRGDRGGRGRDRQRASSRPRMSRVDCYVMCVVESVTHIRGDDDYAPACSVRVRVHLPGLPSSSSSSSASLPSGVGSLARRTRQMWNLFQPPPTEEKEVSGKSTALAAEGMFSLVRLDSPVTTLREYIALQHIDSLTLLPHLLQPSPNPTTATADSSSPAVSDVERTFSLLPNHFRSYLSTHLNEHQLLAVQSATHRSLSPGFTLLQGPPGTGKTKTVIAVLNCLHLRAFPTALRQSHTLHPHVNSS